MRLVGGNGKEPPNTALGLILYCKARKPSSLIADGWNDRWTKIATPQFHSLRLTHLISRTPNLADFQRGHKRFVFLSLWLFLIFKAHC